MMKGQKSIQDWLIPSQPSTSRGSTRVESNAMPSHDSDSDDDKLLLAALDAEEKKQKVERSDGTSEISALNSVETLPGFDLDAGKDWIYPTNYPVRSYQYTIVEKALFENTMVSLPTGLGKTFIAAVVMFNFYRWYPQGKTVFMAPTRPLVAQQIEACFSIMGIPMKDTVELTGTMAPKARTTAWKENRVFFLTPQVMMNDLTSRACPAELIKCLVIDEAHKATGNHAYCQVVRELTRRHNQFRILALSATPGTDFPTLEAVLGNLRIGHIEVRTETSQDILPYIHGRSVDKIVVKLGKEVEEVKRRFIKVLETFSRSIMKNRLVYAKDPGSITKYMLLKSRDAFRQNRPHELSNQQCGVIEGEFAVCMTLAHALELLTTHGIRPFYLFLQNYLQNERPSKMKAELLQHTDFAALLNELQTKFGSNDLRLSQRSPGQEFVIGHPKLEKLREVVLEHFTKMKAKNEPTRVMIFAQYRDSVTEITKMLQQHRPLIRAMSFVGQSSASKRSKGFTQKEQMEVVRRFRDGGYNTLISTCVGEEGLDIGEVDLIVCYDSGKSPIRLVQRMGRTGRKREGRIVVLVTEGKEEQSYNQSLYKQKSMTGILGSDKLASKLVKKTPRMVPKGLNPVCHKMHMNVGKYVNSRKAGSLTNSDKPNYLIGMTRKTGNSSRKGPEEYLTGEEMSEWGHKFQTEIEPKKLDRVPRMMSLGHEDEGPKRNNIIKLSDYYPWQKEFQKTFEVEHSITTRNMVSIFQLAGVMNDNIDVVDYAAEMNLYFNPDDIIEETGPLTSTKTLGADATKLDDSKPVKLHHKRGMLRTVDDSPDADVNCKIIQETKINDFGKPGFQRSFIYFTRARACSPSKIPFLDLPLDKRFVEIPDGFDPLSIGVKEVLRGGNIKNDIVQRDIENLSLRELREESTFLKKSKEVVCSDPIRDVEGISNHPLEMNVLEGSSYYGNRIFLNDAVNNDDNLPQGNNKEVEKTDYAKLPRLPIENYVGTRHKATTDMDMDEHVFAIPLRPVKKVAQTHISKTPDNKIITGDSISSVSNQHNSDVAEMDPDDCYFLESQHQTTTNPQEMCESGNVSLYSVSQIIRMANTTQNKSEIDTSISEEVPDFNLGDIFIEQLLSLEDDLESSDVTPVASTFQLPLEQDRLINKPNPVRSTRTSYPVYPTIEQASKNPLDSPPRKLRRTLDMLTPHRTIKSSESPVIDLQSRRSRKSTSETRVEEKSKSIYYGTTLELGKKLQLNTKRGNAFIEDEAEESGDGSDDDFDALSRSSYESSFVDDGEAGGADIQNVYLQHTKSPRVGVGNIRFAKLHGKASDFCSQMFTQEDSYIQDSFCVGSDNEEKEETPAQKRRRRIITYDSSESDSENQGSESNIQSHVGNNSKISPILNSSANFIEARQQRLKRQKDLQEKFKQSIQGEVNKSVLEDRTKPLDAKLISGENGTTESSSNEGEASRTKEANFISDIKNTVNFSPIITTKSIISDSPLVIVSSRLSCRAPGLVSDLQFKNGCDAKVVPLDGSDIIVSRRMGITRISFSDFSNGSPQSVTGMVDEVKKLNMQFERPILLVELERSKDPKNKPKMKPLTKHLAKLNAKLGSANTRIFHSSSQDESAAIIGFLAKRESNKGYGTKDFSLSGKEECMMNFFLCIPGVHFITALSLVKYFKSIKAFLASSDASISEVAAINPKKAQAIREFLLWKY